MKTVFIHIGQHKTGSTALQRFFEYNEEPLLRHSILYPRTGRVNLEGKAMERHMLLSLAPERDPRLLPSLHREIASSPADSVILSGEGFCRASERPQLQKGIALLRQELEEYDCRIVVYLRPQEELIQSLYNWRIREGHEDRPFRVFLDEYLQEQAHYLSPDRLLKPFDRIFGRESIIVRIYDKSAFVGDSIFKDFMHGIGLPWSPDFIIRDQGGTNKGIPHSTLELMRRIRAELTDNIPDFSALSRFLAEAMEDAGGSDSIHHTMLDYDEKCRIRSLYEPSNARIVERYLGNTGEPLFPDVCMNHDYVAPEKTMKVSDRDVFLAMKALWGSRQAMSNELSATREVAKQSQIAFEQLQKSTLDVLQYINHKP